MVWKRRYLGPTMMNDELRWTKQPLAIRQILTQANESERAQVEFQCTFRAVPVRFPCGSPAVSEPFGCSYRYLPLAHFQCTFRADSIRQNGAADANHGEWTQCHEPGGHLPRCINMRSWCNHCVASDRTTTANKSGWLVINDLMKTNGHLVRLRLQSTS